MSVRRYSPAEIQALYADILGLRSRLLISAEAGELAVALRSAFIANRAALAMTYGKRVVIQEFDLAEAINPQPDPKQVFEDIGLLLYNCISNGGRDFLPEQDRALLEGVRLAVARSLFEEAGAH